MKIPKTSELLMKLLHEMAIKKNHSIISIYSTNSGEPESMQMTVKFDSNELLSMLTTFMVEEPETIDVFVRSIYLAKQEIKQNEMLKGRRN